MQRQKPRSKVVRIVKDNIMTPWSSSSFKKHNKKATVKQLEAAAKRANAVLKETGDEGLAVMLGNALIKKMKRKKGK